MTKKKKCPRAYDTPFDGLTDFGKTPVKRGYEAVKCGKCGKWHISKLAKDDTLFALPIHHTIRMEDDVS